MNHPLTYKSDLNELAQANSQSNLLPTNTFKENALNNPPNIHSNESFNQSPNKENFANNAQGLEKLQELLESKRIMSTLRSIKTSNSINYEDIKLLPALFVDMQEALKKSNANVLELKETIKDKLKNEKKLKEKIKELEEENQKILEKIYKHKGKETELKQRYEKLKLENININQNLQFLNELQAKYEQAMIENKNIKLQNSEFASQLKSFKDQLSDLSKAKQELESKNKKYKNAHGILQNEINNIEEHLEEVKTFQGDIKNMQEGMKTMKEMIKQLEGKKKQLENENIELMNSVKVMKTELKSQLTEKINIVKKLDTTKEISDRISKEKENMLKETLKIREENEKLFQENSKIKEELSFFDEFKNKYSDLFEDFNNLVNENLDLREQLQDKKFTNQDLIKLQEKYETDLFYLNAESNIWKNNFLEISKFKLVNFDPVVKENVENFLKIDNNYIINCPQELKKTSEKMLNYFKQLIEQENYNTINLKKLKEALVKEQERNCEYKAKLENEKFLRRKIHNRYMYLRGNLRVMCRLRPFLPNEIVNKKSQMDSIKISNDNIIINEFNKAPKTFEYDYIFDTKSTQQEVYEEATLLIQSMIHGSNVSIIAYGQTCTGKTYTIQGPDLGKPGVAVRAAKEIFEMIRNERNKECRLTMTIIEIYNEQVYNLLDENTPLLNMYEGKNGNLIIPELVPVTISSFEECQKLFKLAGKFRHISSTEFNARSSRSHCIVTFELKIIDEKNKITRSTLNVLDLAGSERISKSQLKDEKQKKEAICINLSLHALSTVLNSIAIKANHIPYRDSKLTHFLKESLNENYNILLILHLSPHVKDLGETISTLQFGERIVKICHHKTGKEKIKLVAGYNKKDTMKTTIRTNKEDDKENYDEE